MILISYVSIVDVIFNAGVHHAVTVNIGEQPDRLFTRLKFIYTEEDVKNYSEHNFLPLKLPSYLLFCSRP